ncbi:Rha family transcriptional regulator [Listeria booriae]|uniref:Rha family transcriptional regulator n=1 Tax=Listeria booriae TaxID=1552123 RepID=UPI0016277630|nr:Rha family transcriptional regulator [Listeria booriae]MBC1651279.1 Rha family transcriptional regulator [Listeria booriae]
MNRIERTISSVEVAKQVGKRHADLMKDIRTYIGYLSEGKVPPGDFFIEATYLDSNNQERPSFDCTKQGCEMIGNKMIGKKGIQFTAFYVQQFNQMENHIKQQTDMSQLSPELQMFYKLGQALANQEIATKKLENKVDNISEIVALNTTDWRKDANNLINQVAKVRGGYEAYREVRKEIYSELERRGICNLETRLTNKRRRMADEGVSKSKREKLTKVDVIADDKKLVEIYIAIVKEFAIKSGVDNECQR